MSLSRVRLNSSHLRCRFCSNHIWTARKKTKSLWIANLSQRTAPSTIQWSFNKASKLLYSRVKCPTIMGTALELWSALKGQAKEFQIRILWQHWSPHLELKNSQTPSRGKTRFKIRSGSNRVWVAVKLVWWLSGLRSRRVLRLKRRFKSTCNRPLMLIFPAFSALKRLRTQ